ncbi:hypothetical protein HHO41_19365 [Bacillus sp. DNRA2]|uniref:hypothetical protein n=1 Tax=Bacillus sp. DNRA2 TaxID=2723053 RepID=UPI00145CCE58|nr:hypothetical protein [Bacillus sp. DNRA2]NMD72433.1 hypothetical protein [Bacillus sp. DNRA2]
MDVTELREKVDISNWLNYNPWIVQYSKYLPNVITASVKIVDVYYQISNARVSIDYMNVDNYGQLIGKDDYLHKQFIKSKFLFDSLAYYNYSIDLSWQVLYFYFGDKDYGVLQDKKRYEQLSKECNEQNLRLQLWFHNQKKLSKYVFDFFNDQKTKEIREIYNYLKHRGTFYIDGLGENDEFLPINLNGSRLRMINREEVDLSEWKEKLIQFDVFFYEYFNNLINWIMPKDYTVKSMGIGEQIGLMYRLKSWEQGQQKIQ